MKSGSIPSSWVSLTNMMAAQPLLALLEEVNTRGIAHNDLPAVHEVWRELNDKVREQLAELSKRHVDREKAIQADAQVRQNLEDTFPASKRKRT